MAAQLMAMNSPFRPLFSCTARASSSLPVPDAPSSITDTSALATRSIVLRDLQHLRRRADDRAECLAAAGLLQPPVLGLDIRDVESARDDQSELVDVDRLAVEVVGAKRDRPAACFRERRGPTRRSPWCRASASGFRRASRNLRSSRPDRAAGQGRASPPPARATRSASIAASRCRASTHFIVLIGPVQLALQPFVILDDQQHGSFWSLMRVSVQIGRHRLGRRAEKW